MAKTFLVTVTNDLNQDQRMHRICSSLSSAGHRVMLVGRVKPTSSPLLDQIFEQKRLKCIFSKGILFYLEYNIRLLFFGLRFRPDVFYSVDLDTLLACGLASRFISKKVIHDAHEYFVEVPELEGKSFKKRIWNSIGVQFIPKCILCITVNIELAKILSEKYKNVFEVVRSVPSQNDKNKKDNAPNHIPVILYQGVLNKGRGLEESITAVCQMREEVIFRIAGEGDLSNELRALAKNLNGGDKIQFLGWLSPKELKQETLKADIGMNLLSGNSLNYKYSLANKFFDYMHAGVPSLNMNFPVYKRICKEYEVGLCIDNLDQNHIQNAIRSLINDNGRYDRMQKACHLASEKYNWNRESKVLLDLIEKCM